MFPSVGGVCEVMRRLPMTTLRGCRTLVVLAGALHLFMTQHLMHRLGRYLTGDSETAGGMLLDHVVAGGSLWSLAHDFLS